MLWKKILYQLQLEALNSWARNSLAHEWLVTSASIHRVFLPDDLPQLLASVDHVVNILPSTIATRFLLSGDVLRACTKARIVLVGAHVNCVTLGI